MRRLLPVGAAVAGLAVIGYALFAKPTDEELILRRLEALEAAVQVDSDTSRNPVLRAGALGSAFEDIFTEDVTFSIPELTSAERGRPALAALGSRATAHLSTLIVDFGSTDVKLVAGSFVATVNTVAALEATRGSGGVQRDRRNVTFDLKKDDGDWLISGIRVAPKD